MVRKVLILTIIVLAMSACGRAPGTPARIPQASDSLYTAQAALKVYGTQPDQALAIIDSALVIGNVSPFRADFLRAMVYANSVERPQLSKAISLCVPANYPTYGRKAGAWYHTETRIEPCTHPGYNASNCPYHVHP